MPTKNLLALKKIVFYLAFGWTVLIAVLCLVSFNNLPSIRVSSADKYVHVTFHFVFTLLWGFYFRYRQNEIRIYTVIRIVAISLLYGIIIEFLQETLTKTRHADLLDVAANFSGALLALAVFAYLKKSKRAQ